MLSVKFWIIFLITFWILLRSLKFLKLCYQRRTGKSLKKFKPLAMLNIISIIITILGFIFALYAYFKPHKADNKLSEQILLVTKGYRSFYNLSFLSFYRNYDPKISKKLYYSETLKEIYTHLQFYFKGKTIDYFYNHEFELVNESSQNFDKDSFKYGEPILISLEIDPFINEIYIDDDECSTGLKLDSTKYVDNYVFYYLSFRIFNSLDKVKLFLPRSVEKLSKLIFKGKFKGISSSKFVIIKPLKLRDDSDFILPAITALFYSIIIYIFLYFYIRFEIFIFKPLKIAVSNKLIGNEFKIWRELGEPLKSIYLSKKENRNEIDNLLKHLNEYDKLLKNEHLLDKLFLKIESKSKKNEIED